jgi:hypothetical protein
MYVCMYVWTVRELHYDGCPGESAQSAGSERHVTLHRPGGHRAIQQRVSCVCMYVSQCLCVSMYELDWKCRRCFIMYANSKYTVCMHVC